MRQIRQRQRFTQCGRTATQLVEPHAADGVYGEAEMRGLRTQQHHVAAATRTETEIVADDDRTRTERSEEHTSELQSLMRTSYAVFCLKKKKKNTKRITPIKHIKHHRLKTNTKDA